MTYKPLHQFILGGSFYFKVMDDEVDRVFRFSHFMNDKFATVYNHPSDPHFISIDMYVTEVPKDQVPFNV